MNTRPFLPGPARPIVELDHATLDLLMIDSKTGQVLGRPVMTVAIDVHTGRPVRLHFGFEPLRDLAKLKTIVNPKQSMTNRKNRS
ncbi:MAG: hypothetical protein WC736_16255 [Gallionella sp.]|jgi:hypothetical protein